MLKFLLSALVVLTVAPLASADLIVSVRTDNAPPLVPGGTSWVEIYLQTDAGTSNLQEFGLELRITNLTTGSTSQLAFDYTTPPTDTQFTDLDYMFFGNSLVQDVAMPSGVLLTTNWMNDTYIGGDATLDMSSVSVGTSPSLLLRLGLTTSTSEPPEVGDQFAISVASLLNTVFLDGTGNPMTFTTQAAEITAVPEPSGLVLGSIVGLTVLGARWLRHRRHQ